MPWWLALLLAVALAALVWWLTNIIQSARYSKAMNEANSELQKARDESLILKGRLQIFAKREAELKEALSQVDSKVTDLSNQSATATRNTTTVRHVYETSKTPAFVSSGNIITDRDQLGAKLESLGIAAR